MRLSVCDSFVLFLSVAVFCPLTPAVQPSRSEASKTDLTAKGTMRLVVRNSGYIFAGTVQSVQRISPKGNGVATVQVTFHVNQAMRGVRAGQTLVVREWAGLWQSRERYRKGEQVLLFLYPPSKLGLTSPVGSTLGRFPIGHDGLVGVDPRIGVRAGRAALVRLSPREFVRFFRKEAEE
jgi:hypothetical protein